MAFIEINKSPTSSNADGAVANGSNVITLDSSDSFPTAGTIVFLDSLSQLQKLTYTANNTSTERLSGTAASWTGSGTLLNDTAIYENSYDAISNTTSVEISSSQAVLKASTTTNNGATVVSIADANALTAAGAIIFTDSAGDSQRLLYTAVDMSGSPNRLTGVTSWTGTGNLADETNVYQSFGNTTFTEVAIS